MPAYNIIAVHNNRQVGSTLIAHNNISAVTAAAKQVGIDENKKGSALEFFKLYRVDEIQL